MQVNGPKFKVNTIDTGSPGAGGPAVPNEIEQSNELQGEHIEDYCDSIFGDPYDSGQPRAKSKTNNVNRLNDYTLNDIQDGQYVGDPNVEILEWLSNFPPSLEDIIAGNEHAINYLDLVRERYEKGQNDLHLLIGNWQKVLAAGGLTANEIQMINQRISLASQALAGCESELIKLGELENQMKDLYEQELRSGKDLNNDGWLGKPFTQGSYKIQKNADGTITLIDAVSGRALAGVFTDPDYSAQLTTDNSLEMIDISEAANYAGEIAQGEDGEYAYTEGRVDLFLKLTENAFANSANHHYGATIDIGMPEFLWVKRNYYDEKLTEPYKIEYDQQLGLERYVLYDNWSTEGGIRQEVPADLSKYVQIKVTGAKIRSVDSGLADANHPNNGKLYHHFLEFYNGETLIARIRIEGMEAAGHPLATMTDLGPSYVAASTASFAVNGDTRASEMEFDAGGMRSTGKHIYAGLEEELGLNTPGSDQGRRAYNENIDLFTKENFTTQYYEVAADGTGAWKDQGHSIMNPGGYADRYMPPEIEAPEPTDNGDGTATIQQPLISAEGAGYEPSENDTVFSFRTGIWIDGLRGNISGTNYNDVIRTRGVNELTDYSKDHTTAHQKPILKGDAFYSNVVRAQGGNDIVVAGQGDNYIMDATFVSVTAGSNDDNFIATPDIVTYGSGKDFSKKSKNPKVYVNVEGGNESYIGLPNEFDFANYEDVDASATGEKAVDAWDAAYVDDYFDIDSNAVVFSEPPYPDENAGNEAQQTAMRLDNNGIYQAASEAEELFWEELTNVPEVDETQAEATMDEVMGEKTILDDEMNGFFNEMFGDMEGMFSDMGFEDEILPSEGVI